METTTKKTDEVFLTDSNYILELNLQKMRKELITMIEMFEHEDCNTCKLLKCSCTEPSSAEPARTERTAGSGRHSPGTTSLDFSTIAPSANVLPKPIWENAASDSSDPKSEVKDVESWVRASTPSAQPLLPEAKTPDWSDAGRDGPATHTWLSFRGTDRSDKASSSDATGANSPFNATMRKIVYDLKNKSKPTLHWSSIKTTTSQAGQKYQSNIFGNKPTAKAEAKTVSNLNLAATSLDSIGNNCLGLYEVTRGATSARNAVDAFFRSFKKPANSGAHSNVSVSTTLNQLASGYTYF